MVSTQKPSFGFHKRVNLTFNDAVEKVKSALQAEGFGVLTEIDITQTLKTKIDADLGHRYVILGACKPNLAYQALQAEPDLGLLLPCNVIVYESKDGNGCEVAAIDPEAALGIVGNEQLTEIARTAAKHLRTAVDAV